MLVLEREARLEMPVGVARRFGVGADRKAEGLVRVTLGPEHPGDGPGRTGSDDGHRRLELLASRLDAHDAFAIEHGERFGFETDLGAGFLRNADQRLIEPASGPDRSVWCEAAVVGPGKLPPSRTGDHAQPVDPVRIVHVDLEFVERSDRTGGQAVAADLVPPTNPLLEHRDVDAGPSRTNGGGRAGRTAADHEQITLFHATSLPDRDAQTAVGRQGSHRRWSPAQGSCPVWPRARRRRRS